MKMKKTPETVEISYWGKMHQCKYEEEKQNKAMKPLKAAICANCTNGKGQGYQWSPCPFNIDINCCYSFLSSPKKLLRSNVFLHMSAIT